MERGPKEISEEEGRGGDGDMFKTFADYLSSMYV